MHRLRGGVLRRPSRGTEGPGRQGLLRAAHVREGLTRAGLSRLPADRRRRSTVLLVRNESEAQAGEDVPGLRPAGPRHDRRVQVVPGQASRRGAPGASQGAPPPCRPGAGEPSARAGQGEGPAAEPEPASWAVGGAAGAEAWSTSQASPVAVAANVSIGIAP